MSARRGRSVSRLGLGMLLVLIGLVAFAGGAWLFATRADSPGAFPAPHSGPLPRLKRIYLIVFENRPYGDVIGNAHAPTFNALASQGALATDYHSISKPSQPNYVALVAGGTLGVSDDKVYDLSAANLADQLESKGLNWSVSAENLPDPCFKGETASDATDGTGTYVRKHEPFISFTQISGNTARCSRHIHNLRAFDPAEADFQLIVPNLCHDAHDCAIEVADQWLAGFAPRILQSPAFRDGGVLFITFDEGSRFSDRIPLIALGAGVRPGSQSADNRNHYAWLRTVQDAWGLACLANSCTAGNLSGLFQAP